MSWKRMEELGIRDVGVRLVSAQAIQNEVDAINLDDPPKGYDHLRRKISRLQYFISVESSDLIDNIDTLDSLSIVDNTRNNKRHSQLLRQKSETLVARASAAAECPNSSGGVHHCDTASSHEHKEDSKSSKSLEELDEGDLDLNLSDSDDESDSSDSSEDDDDEGEVVVKAPWKLKKYRAELLVKIEQLINYMDKMSHELSRMKEVVLSKKHNFIGLPANISLKDSFDMQSPAIRFKLACERARSNAGEGDSMSHVAASANEQPLTSPVTEQTLRIHSPVLKSKLHELNLASCDEIFQIDHIHEKDEDDFDNSSYDQQASTPVQQLNDYRKKKGNIIVQ
ncbi:hypothetical protein SAMD00019534_085420 [Acytostelium subglobosum LB1]|uniref:hypothetical protein n=1 Tax=Acytostelium subglobosum LB1 TaxID=1410327 RepID=UPI000644F198|nr:hypothetical protein SAMD00019534_085420 [Acytostelium subglobosum LB1]GAM25367.1 hypothetical protein SAMD00019534_085420 [Acytostelium subglobosum LB1]|eukprot:XP_012751887.1 hypothetical protein SAMD00019534_085420 [Acytostelium subglobosum LB1]